MLAAGAMAFCACDIIRPPHAARVEGLDVTDLPHWNGTLDLVLGEDEAEGVTFHMPHPLGADSKGRILVVDRRLLEVKAFGPDGGYLGTIVRPGSGPGEMRVLPYGHGLIADTLWFSEMPTGRVHLIAPDGNRSTEDTGFAPGRFGADWIALQRLPRGEGYWARARGIEPGTRHDFRPTYSLTLLKGRTADDAQIVHNVSYPATSLHFDQGGTLVGYPGPHEDPIVLPLSDGERFVEIRRTIESGTADVSAQVRLHDTNGTLLRTRQIVLPAVALPDTVKDGFEQRILDGAGIVTGRRLPAAVRNQIRELVRGMPGVLPAVLQAAAGLDHTIWLQVPDEEQAGTQTWLVLNERLEPVATASLPVNVRSIDFASDGRAWAVLFGAEGTRYVGRLSFRVED